MNDRNSVAAEPAGQTEPLKKRLQQVLNSENLEPHRNLIRAIAAELGADILDCAAALLYLQPSAAKIRPVDPWEAQKPVPSLPPMIMVRYRLEVGRAHQVTLEEIKKVLVEESGVDKSNINRVNIHDSYTIIELPAGMPPDIFQHLKSVEINQQKLNIARVKARGNKKRGKSNFRRGRQRTPQSDSQGTDISVL